MFIPPLKFCSFDNMENGAKLQRIDRNFIESGCLIQSKCYFADI